ncbi:MAG TPA: hypothetical protein PKL64_07690 [Bacteroidales bacterium]|nr:hypothetical protein [Bacteroidales bacterium]
MKQIKILGLLITDRIKESGQTQKVLTDYAHIIQNRLGFHELSDKVCSRSGIIILQLAGKQEEWAKFETALAAIRGLEVKEMTFTL